MRKFLVMVTLIMFITIAGSGSSRVLLGGGSPLVGGAPGIININCDEDDPEEPNDSINLGCDSFSYNNL